MVTDNVCSQPGAQQPLLTLKPVGLFSQDQQTQAALGFLTPPDPKADASGHGAQKR